MSLLPGLTGAGGAVSFFWTPMGTRACGLKIGPASASSMFIYSGTASWYQRGGPFSWSQNVVDWFNKNIPSPALDTVGATRDFIREIKDKLEQLTVPLPSI